MRCKSYTNCNYFHWWATLTWRAWKCKRIHTDVRSSHFCINRGFYTTLIFSTFTPFSVFTRRHLTTVFLPHGMGLVSIFCCICLRSQVAKWNVNLTCEVCTIFIMLVLASLAQNKTCVANCLRSAGVFEASHSSICRHTSTNWFCLLLSLLSISLGDHKVFLYNKNILFREAPKCSPTTSRSSTSRLRTRTRTSSLEVSSLCIV